MKHLFMILVIIMACQFAGCIKPNDALRQVRIPAKSGTVDDEKMNTSGVVYILVDQRDLYHVIRGSVWHTTKGIGALMDYVNKNMPNAESFAVFDGVVSSKMVSAAEAGEIYLQIMKPTGQSNTRDVLTFQVTRSSYSPDNPNNEMRDSLKKKFSKGERGIKVSENVEQNKTNMAGKYNTDGLVYIVRNSSNDFNVFRGTFKDYGDLESVMMIIDKEMFNAEWITFVSTGKMEPEMQERIYSQIVNSKGHANSHKIFSFLMPSSDNSGVVDLAPALHEKFNN